MTWVLFYCATCWRFLSINFNYQNKQGKRPIYKQHLELGFDLIEFHDFCRGLSGNKEERPTCRVYIEILTCHAIFYHLEDSRSHGNEREADRARGHGARPTPLGACPPLLANQHESRGSCSTDLKDQGEPLNLCRFDPTAQIHLKRL